MDLQQPKQILQRNIHFHLQILHKQIQHQIHFTCFHFFFDPIVWFFFRFTFVDEIDDLRSDSDDALNNLSKNYVRRALNDLREDKAKAIRNFEGEEEVEDSTNLEENPNWPTFQYASSFLNLEVRRREGWRSSLLGMTPPSFKSEIIPKHRRPGENGLRLPIETNSTEEVSTWTRWKNGLSRLMSSAVVTALVARFSIRK